MDISIKYSGKCIFFFFVCLVFALNRLLSPQQSSICLYYIKLNRNKVPSERREAFSRDDMDYKRELLLLTLLLVSLSLLFLFFFPPVLFADRQIAL